MKNGPKTTKICKSRFTTLPNSKKVTQEMAKNFAKWQNFAKSGHTDHNCPSLLSWDESLYGVEMLY